MRQFTRNLVLTILALAVQGLFAAAQAQIIYTLGSGGWSPSGGPFVVNGNITTVTEDIVGNLVITVPGVTVDGDGHQLSGSGNGISIIGEGGVTIRNFGSISNFENGIFISSGSTSPMQGCTIADNWILDEGGVGRGIYIATGSQINANHTISGNHFIGCGDGVAITGTFSTPSTGHNIFGNTMQNNTTVLRLENVGSTSVYNNNFIGLATQVVQVGSNVSNVFSKPLPVGGNHWSDWSPISDPPQIDTDGDGIVNSPYPNATPPDALPWTTPNRWTGPPSSTPLVSEASFQSGTPGQNSWYTSNVVIDLSVNDPSRLRSIRYSINSLSNWQKSDIPLGVTISADGVNTLYFYSITSEYPDFLDNPEQLPQSYVVKVDKTAPTTTASLSGTLGTNGWYESNVSVSLTGADGASGISSTEYSFDGTTWASPPVPTITQSRTVYFRSTDNAGNVENAKSVNVQINPTITASAGPNGSISPSGTVYVNNAQNQLFTFTPNTGYHVAEVVVDDVPAGAAASYTFTNVTAHHTISASFAIDQFTLTYIAGTGGSITGSTSQTVNYDANGTPVTAVPNPGWSFTGWSDGVTTAARTDLNVHANLSVTANFATTTFTLTYTAGSGGTISGTSPQTVNFGSSGTAVTAVPNTGYHFAGWSDGVTTASRTDNNVTANISVTANFAITTFTLTYTAGSGGTITGTSPQTVNYGASGTAVTAVPNTGYSFVSWSDGVLTATRTDLSVTANISVTASFAINTFTLTYTAGANGTISGTSPQTVNFGSSGTAVTAVPNTGYHFTGWSDGVTTASRTDNNVTAIISVTANFAISTFTLTASAGANGTITPSGTQTVNSGTNQDFTITPNAGYNVTDVLVDGASVGAVTTYTFTNVTANHTIAASFAASSTATGSAAGAGSISSPAGSYVSKPAYTGKGYFAFAAGYIRNNPLPIGLTTFTLKSASFFSKAAFTFTSFNYEALTFSGNQGTLVGTGKVNGSGNYGFLMSFTDGHASNTSDKLRMKIWNKNSANAVFYDSQMGAADDASPAATVTGGVITITRSGESTAAMDMDVQELIAADDLAQLPTEYTLYNAYPNPFNPSTTIKFDLPEATTVRLAVFDMLGREVAVLVGGERLAGQHTVVFDAGKLASGMYIYRLQTGGYTQTKKLMLMK